MRISSLVLAATFVAASAVSSFAASSDCGRGPPAWWNAPKVSYTYSGSSYGSGYSRSSYSSGYSRTSYSSSYGRSSYTSGNSHTFSAQRRAPTYTVSTRYRDPYGRW